MTDPCRLVPPPDRKQALLCADCGRPYARIQNGVLIIESRHGSAVHQNVIPLARLIELLQAAGVVCEPAA